MPNWCTNRLLVAGTLEKVNVFMEDHVKFSFEVVCPIHEDLHIRAGTFPKGSPEEEQHKQQEKVNLEKHNYKNWYDFAIGEWGTKWDAVNPVIEWREEDDDFSKLLIQFETAWAPPEAWLKKVAEKYEELNFLLYFFEPGLAFEGVIEFSRGEIVEHHTQEYIAI